MYPIVKIPPLILRTSNLVSVSTRVNGSVDIRALRSIFFRESVDRPKLINSINLIGYLLLFLSTVIFTATVFIGRNWLGYSCIAFFLGLASVNIADLLAVTSRKKERYELSTVRSVDSIQPIHPDTIDWEKILTGKVLKHGDIAQAQVGVSEAHFERYLKKYFGDYLKPGYEFELNDRFKYSSDFTLILPNSISLIIEVDEPYEGRTKQPHHCKDGGKDNYRDSFFVKGNWIVIRFSEFQVCAFPDECCYKIAKVIDSIDLSYSFTNLFEGVGRLPLDPTWSEREAKAMAKRDYRLEYLIRYKIYTPTSESSGRETDRKVKKDKNAASSRKQKS